MLPTYRKGLGPWRTLALFLVTFPIFLVWELLKELRRKFARRG